MSSGLEGLRPVCYESNIISTKSLVASTPNRGSNNPLSRLFKMRAPKSKTFVGRARENIAEPQDERFESDIRLLLLQQGRAEGFDRYYSSFYTSLGFPSPTKYQ